MLSYKLKHMFSCVFASMATFGLLSLGHRDAHAKNVDPDTTFSFTKNAHDFEVLVVYNAKCNIGGEAKGLRGTSGYYDATGISGISPACTYTCAEDHYVWDSHAGKLATEYTIDGPEGSGSKTTERSCFPKPKCTKGVGVSYAYVKGNENGLWCAGTCSDGYSSGGGTDTTTTVSGMNNTAATLECQGRNYTMTVNCISGLYKNTESSIGEVTVTFGGDVKAPKAEDCVWEGHNVTAYSVPDDI